MAANHPSPARQPRNTARRLLFAAEHGIASAIHDLTSRPDRDHVDRQDIDQLIEAHRLIQQVSRRDRRYAATGIAGWRVRVTPTVGEPVDFDVVASDEAHATGLAEQAWAISTAPADGGCGRLPEIRSVKVISTPGLAPTVRQGGVLLGDALARLR